MGTRSVSQGSLEQITIRIFQQFNISIIHTAMRISTAAAHPVSCFIVVFGFVDRLGVTHTSHKRLTLTEGFER